jgi:ubiquinone/menaquinone biosynthesis C-methylase UbiE
MSSVLSEQQQYYNNRAKEYDQWWERKGQYNQGEEKNKLFFTDREQLESEFLYDLQFRLTPNTKVLELACGTGNFTRLLVSSFNHQDQHLHLVDGSQEMLDICLNKISNNSHVKSVEKRDLLCGEPLSSHSEFDIVFTSFFLSHIPPDLLQGFLANIKKILKKNGTLIVLDSGPNKSLSSKHTYELNPAYEHDKQTIIKRHLENGTVYNIVKVIYEPNNLDNELHSAGLKGKTRVTANDMFINGTFTLE